MDDYVSNFKACEEQRDRLSQLKEEELKKFEDKLQLIAN